MKNLIKGTLAPLVIVIVSLFGALGGAQGLVVAGLVTTTSCVTEEGSREISLSSDATSSAMADATERYNRGEMSKDEYKSLVSALLLDHQSVIEDNLSEGLADAVAKLGPAAGATGPLGMLSSMLALFGISEYRRKKGFEKLDNSL
jgi:hypothetical protein